MNGGAAHGSQRPFIPVFVRRLGALSQTLFIGRFNSCVVNKGDKKIGDSKLVAVAQPVFLDAFVFNTGSIEAGINQQVPLIIA